MSSSKTKSAQTTDYGFWPSQLSAAEAVAGQKQYSQLRCDNKGDLYWLEYQPEAQGRNALCRYQPSTGNREVLTPSNFSARSRVHEYGGACWCLLESQLAFINDEDQQLWLQSLNDIETASVQLTDQPGSRFAAPIWDQCRNRLVAVQEVHQDDQVTNQLVAIALDNSNIEILHSGHDFYGAPALSHDHQQLAWVSWDHPDQPWTRTRLYHSNISSRGGLSKIEVVAGTEQVQALTQPYFDHQQQLIAITDQGNWWLPHRFNKDSTSGHWQSEALCQQEAEYSAAPWQLGNRNLSWLEDGSWVGACQSEGKGQLIWQRADSAQQLASQYQHFGELAHHQNHLYVVAASAETLPHIIQLDLESAAIRSVTQPSLKHQDIAQPEPIRFPVGTESHSYGYFYAPENSTASAPSYSLPPLIVTLHGGPSAATYPVLKPALQYWTQRGFAVLDLNYRGSTGYGRAYRLQLQGSWGISDIEDTEAAIDYLAAQSRIDGDRVFIRGSSAGGYTTLAALVQSDRYRAAACLYGISDLRQLAAHTHKFESRYLDWLIGDLKKDSQRYQARSPVFHADQISCPVIFFQGQQDKVVPPDQTEQIAKAMRKRNIEVEYHLFLEEAHGFRDPDNQQQVLEQELAFYQRFL